MLARATAGEFVKYVLIVSTVGGGQGAYRSNCRLGSLFYFKNFWVFTLGECSPSDAIIHLVQAHLWYRLLDFERAGVGEAGCYLLRRLHAM